MKNNQELFYQKLNNGIDSLGQSLDLTFKSLSLSLLIIVAIIATIYLCFAIYEYHEALITKYQTYKRNKNSIAIQLAIPHINNMKIAVDELFSVGGHKIYKINESFGLIMGTELKALCNYEMDTQVEIKSFEAWEIYRLIQNKNNQFKKIEEIQKEKQKKLILEKNKTNKEGLSSV